MSDSASCSPTRKDGRGSVVKGGAECKRQDVLKSSAAVNNRPAVDWIGDTRSGNVIVR